MGVDAFYKAFFRFSDEYAENLIKDATFEFLKDFGTAWSEQLITIFKTEAFDEKGIYELLKTASKEQKIEFARTWRSVYENPNIPNRSEVLTKIGGKGSIEEMVRYTSNWGRYPDNWVEFENIAEKIENLRGHVLRVEVNSDGSFALKDLTRNGTTYQLVGFKGGHIERALIEFTESNKLTYEIKNRVVGSNGVYEGQPVIYSKDNEYVKLNGRFVEYETGKWGGTASYFPADMSDDGIIAMVIYAVGNNHGLVEGKTSLYMGYSSGVSIEIHFAFNPDGTGTFYPIKK